MICQGNIENTNKFWEKSGNLKMNCYRSLEMEVFKNLYLFCIIQGNYIHAQKYISISSLELLLTLLHSERPKLYAILAFLSAIIGLNEKIYFHGEQRSFFNNNLQISCGKGIKVVHV